MRFLASLFLAPALLLPVSCITISDDGLAEARTVTESVEAGDVEIVNAEIKMPAGELRIESGAAKLMDGEFRFTDAALEPEVVYDSFGMRGRLTVEAAKHLSTTGIHGSNEWGIRFNNDLPINLDVTLGAGECHLDPVGMSLRGLELHVGAGECELDLVGEWDSGFDVKVRGGVGELTVRVPGNVGIAADIKAGIGDINHPGLVKKDGRYVNEAYGDASVTITLDLKGGIGEINLITVD